ncbi:hypothetical protein [Peredibacter starrii]|uniref:DUF2987 domain-containing protein n=1 Tax=Peredibacter starrii TaxID=28202 RepID=A0AAX4HPZ0_9BACT|nr:hypothetical protein [Peredibacter starrii]WPU65176.1 hypothetical protein SOO65_00240 [Peredibacter starrii]
MRKFFLIFCLLLSFNAFSESTLVHPFELEFSAPENRFNLKAELLLSCRYEKLVWGDSSEFHVKDEVISLPIAIKKNQIKISHSKTSSMKLDGRFRSNPGCMSELRLTFTDAQYAVGWAGQMNRPITFALKDGHFYRAGDSVLDISKLEAQIANRLVDFLYVPAASQVNIWMTADGQRLPISPTSSAIDPQTKMPYRLKTK